MTDLLLLVVMFLVCAGLGLPCTEWLPRERFAWRLAIAPALGFALLGVATPVAYRWGATIPMIFYTAIGIACALIAMRASRLVRDARALADADRRAIWIAVACCAAAAIMMLLPRFVGGDQFAVFQGNTWDTYGYLDSAMIYARKPYSIVSVATDNQVLHNPLYDLARVSLTDRPSAHMLYGVFSRIAPGQAYHLYYTYLVGCYVQLVLVGIFAARAVLPRASACVWCAVAVVFPLGFWGQYVLDIDAWSQIASASSLLLVVVLSVHAAVVPVRADAPIAQAWKLAAVLGLCIAGGVFVYPEGFAIYVAGAAPVAGVIVLWKMIRARRFSLRVIVPLLGYLAVAAAVLYPPLLHHLLSQLDHTSSTKVPWWQYFQMFFLGRDARAGTSLGLLVDLVAGVFGLYFVTPSHRTHTVYALGLRGAIVVIVVGLILAVIAMIAGRASERDGEPVEPASRHLLAAWSAVGLLMLAPAAYLARDANYWPAGKIVSYAAPVVMFVLAIPVGAYYARAWRPLRWIVVAFVTIQLAASFGRVVASVDGLGYLPPYPSVQNRGLKTELGWDLSGLEPLLSSEMKVFIRPMDQWLEQEVMIFLWSRNITFGKASETIIGFGAAANLGAARPAWKPDVELESAGHELVLHYADGRPDARVSTGGDLR